MLSLPNNTLSQRAGSSSISSTHLSQRSALAGRRSSRQCRERAAGLVPHASAFQASVRPFTLRKGDNLETISKKRGITVEQLLEINPDLVGQPLPVEGQTILLPAAKLSVRDKEILGGIGAGYRLYPVRNGESVEDIMQKRGITKAEMQSLNPGVDLRQSQDNKVLKLPANKYTVREREMLIGSGILPTEFFEAAKNPFVLGVGGLLGVCGFVLAWMLNYKGDDYGDLPGKEDLKA